MKQLEPRNLKGFRDFLPNEARKRQYVIDVLKTVFESFGFEPLETPALEYEELLIGKYGEEGDKLMYRFEDNGQRKVAMRYDQTVPLARVVTQHQNELPLPFKRYQIQPVWRAENTQKGRYREFLQCDADIVGGTSSLSDAEIVALAAKTIETLGILNYKIYINDRKNLQFFINGDVLSTEKNTQVIRALDKLKKIGKVGVNEELINNGFSQNDITFLLNDIENKKPTILLQEIMSNVTSFGINASKIEFSPTLARGLDYYTGLIFEIEIDNYTSGSICGGGRYDNLIGIFSERLIPAVGFAFGFDRLLESMEQLSLFPTSLQTTKVLVTIFSPDLKDKSIEISSILRINNINTELYLDENAKMEKQLKYANNKNIPYVVIIGPTEAEKNMVQLKNMETREQKEITIKELISILK